MRTFNHGKLFAVYLLAYTSVATAPLSEQQVDELASQASEKNTMLGITGFLNYDFRKQQFLQVLEGHDSEVESLIEKIAVDPRHQQLNILRIGNSPRRLFPNWWMRLIDEETADMISLESLLDGCLRKMAAPPYDRQWLQESALRMITQVAQLKAGGRLR